jgi:hypothetical protein
VTERHRTDDAPDDAPADADDTALGRTTQQTGYGEIVPDPGSGSDPQTGEEAADQAERLESHNRPTAEPEEPAAPGPET